MKKFFIGSIGAEKKMSYSTTVESLAYGTINARSQEEAIGMGISEALGQWPAGEWFNHWANIVEVPEDVINAIRSDDWLVE